MFVKNNLFKKQRSVSPLIATILLIVVSVILVVVILAWGTDFTTSELASATELLTEDKSLIGFLSISHHHENIYKLRTDYRDPITITKYQIVGTISDANSLLNKTITLKEPLTLTYGAVRLFPLACIPESNFAVNLITEDNKYVSISNVRGYNHTPDWCEMTLVGTGSEEDPYRAYNVFQLNDIKNHLGEINEDTNFTLERDVDFNWFSLSEFSSISGFGDYDTNGWSSIGHDWTNSFRGNFDGKNNVIRNLYIYRPTQNYVGLFGYATNSEIKNLGLEDVNVTGNWYVGGLIGVLENSNIFNTFTIGHISGNYAVGGLIGEIINTLDKTVQNSYSKGVVTISSGLWNTGGGLIGHGSGHLYNNYSEADLFSNSRTTGGLVGALKDDMGEIIVENCYSFGLINASSENVGGLIGEQWDLELVSIINSFWDIESSEQEESDGGIGKTTEEMKTKSTFIDWDFNTIWQIQEGVTYPYLRNNQQSPPPQ